MAITNLTGTTWQFVDNYNEWSEYPFQEFSYTINFTSNGNNYTLLASDASTSGYFLLYNTTTVYGPSGGPPAWVNQNYRMISITGGSDATNATLIAWLEANAVQQGGGGSETTITYGGNTIATLSAGQTFTSSGLANKLTSTNIVITANGASGEKTTVTYNGNTVFDQQSGTYTIPANNIIPYEFAVAYVSAPSYPVKGDVIELDTLSTKWRVLKINGSVAELLSQESYSSGTFASSGNTYENSTLDSRLNTTYYGTLSSTIKSAIVDKTFRQDRWYVSTTGNPDYIGTYNTSTQYTISLNSASYGNEITRHVYAISIQDIVDYVEVTPQMTSSNTTLNRTNMRLLYNWSSSGNAWTRTAYAGNSNQALIANYTGRIQGGTSSSSYRSYPAFQIDLSKISWEQSSN